MIQQQTWHDIADNNGDNGDDDDAETRERFC